MNHRMNRQKQIEITEDIVAQIERVTKTTIDPDNIVVFEANSASTRPIKKPGSIYDGAIMSRQLLEDMAEAVNSGEQSVPLHTLHRQGGEIPIGRVFQASVTDAPDGSSDLKAMFFLPKMEKELIEKINLSVLDEVSVGMKPKQGLCSKCGFDFFGPESDFGYIFMQTCENDHVVGQDGMHLKMTGLDYWVELSLVSRGASNKPKILSRVRQSLSQEAHDRIAADGLPVEATLLVASTTEMETLMPKTPEELAAEAAAEAEAAAAASAEEEPAAEGEPPAEEDDPAGGEPPAEEDEDEAEFDIGRALADLKAQMDALEAHLAPEPEPEPTIEDLQAALAAANARIEALEATEEEAEEEEPAPAAKPDLPVGGLAASAVEDAKKQKVPGVLKASAFKTNRKQ